MKKEVLFFKNDTTYNLVEKGGVYDKIIILEGVTKIIGGVKPDLDITSYNSSGEICWSIWTIRLSYEIFDLKLKRFIEYSKEEFLNKIKDYYPLDFDFFIWNQDVFNGIYNELTDPEPEIQSISQNGA